MRQWLPGTKVMVQPRHMLRPGRSYILVRQDDGTWTGERHVLGDDEDLRRNYLVMHVYGIERFHHAVELRVDRVLEEANRKFGEASDRVLGYDYS